MTCSMATLQQLFVEHLACFLPAHLKSVEGRHGAESQAELPGASVHIAANRHSHETTPTAFSVPACSALEVLGDARSRHPPFKTRYMETQSLQNRSLNTDSAAATCASAVNGVSDLHPPLWQGATAGTHSTCKRNRKWFVNVARRPNMPSNAARRGVRHPQRHVVKARKDEVCSSSSSLCQGLLKHSLQALVTGLPLHTSIQLIPVDTLLQASHPPRAIQRQQLASMKCQSPAPTAAAHQIIPTHKEREAWWDRPPRQCTSRISCGQHRAGHGDAQALTPWQIAQRSKSEHVQRERAIQHEMKAAAAHPSCTCQVHVQQAAPWLHDCQSCCRPPTRVLHVSRLIRGAPAAWQQPLSAARHSP